MPPSFQAMDCDLVFDAVFETISHTKLSPKYDFFSIFEKYIWCFNTKN
jgi:hypothetical protein